jgi:hypothetical protein
MVVTWATLSTRRMVLKKSPERWETKLANCKVHLKPIAKSLIKICVHMAAIVVAVVVVVVVIAVATLLATVNENVHINF